MKFFNYGFIFALLAIYTITGCSESPSQEQRPRAIDFPNNAPWLNVARPLKLSDLYGKVLLLDFWTYGCINCIHVIPDLEKLEEKYGDKLVVIGVHSPKFTNEKNINTLRNIVVRYDLKHPVVNDVDFALWQQYGVRAWPTFVVIDPAGGVVGKLAGEGHYENLDKAVSLLLNENKKIINDVPIPIVLEKSKLKDTFLAAPGKMSVSKQYVAISDSLHHRVVLANHSGEVIKIIGAGQRGLYDGSAEKALYNTPQGLAFSVNNKYLYVADTGNHAIRQIDLKTFNTVTIAGNGQRGFKRSGEHSALDFSISSPWDLALNKNKLYIAMAGNHQLWQLDLQEKVISPLAGSGYEQLTNGDFSKAGFNQPSGLSLKNNFLYVADAEASAIRRLDLKNKTVSTIVGTGLFDFGDKDGDFKTAKLQHVLGVQAIDENRLLITDTYNHRLKIIDLKAQTVNSLIGNGQPSDDVQNGLNEPGGLAVYQNKIFIADTGNNRIMIYDLNSESLKQWPLNHK